MERSSIKTQNQKRYISNQDILTSLIAIQKSLKEPCNIYGMLKVGLIGRDTKPFHPRLFYLVQFVCIGVT